MIPPLDGRAPHRPRSARWAATAAILLLAPVAQAQSNDAGAPAPVVPVPTTPLPPEPPVSPRETVPPPPAERLAATTPPHPAPLTPSIYGFVELDAMHDSTQSFSETVVNSPIERPSTLAGDNARTHFTARNSRLGFKLATPELGRVRTWAQLEMDFFGNQPSPASEDATFTSPAVRMRHFFVKFETPIVDVLAGQYHDLFGWGGAGYCPNTVAFLGVPGQIYHRDPQLRISKKVVSDGMELELAAAAVRPAQRDGELPDLQGGARIAWDAWRGASAQGAGLPKLAPMSMGVSGVYRRFSVPASSPMASSANTAHGWGAAVNVFLPIIPARSEADLGGSLSATAEATFGAGISNLYTGLTGGGANFPAPPNPLMPTLNADIDQGLVTYDAAGKLHTLNWRAIVLGLQYRAPFGLGRKLGASVVLSQLDSNNLVQLTPVQGLPGVFSSARYVDGNVFYSPTATSQVGVSLQAEEQTFGDGVHGTNIRGELAVYYFF